MKEVFQVLLGKVASVTKPQMQQYITLQQLLQVPKQNVVSKDIHARKTTSTLFWWIK